MIWRKEYTVNRTCMAVLMVAAAFCGPLGLASCGNDASTEASTGTTGFEPKAFASYPYYDDVAGLVEASDVIVVGKVEDTEVRSINLSLESDRLDHPENVECLVSSVRVTRVIKGDLSKGDVIEVKQDPTIEAEGDQLKTRGSAGVLFLAAYPHGIPFDLVNPTQGVLSIEGGRMKAAKGNRLFGDLMSEKEVIDQLDGLVP